MTHVEIYPVDHTEPHMFDSTPQRECLCVLCGSPGKTGAVFLVYPTLAKGASDEEVEALIDSLPEDFVEGKSEIYKLCLKCRNKYPSPEKAIERFRKMRLTGV